MDKPEITLSPEQQVIVAKVGAGDNVLITGSAGTGKSTILRTLAGRMNGALDVCASTGIAAVQVGGLTLHSWAGLGLGDRPAPEIVRDMASRGKKAYQRIKAAKCLAIDEVSMIHGDLFGLVDQVFRAVRRKPGLSFGGVQLVMFGDFLQLPPVSKGQPQAFAFESEAWERAAVQVCMLRKVWRQADQSFADALNLVRVGDVTPEVRRMLASRYRQTDRDPAIKPVIVFTHNADVDQTNAEHLARLRGEEREYPAMDSGEPGPLKTLQKNCLAPEKLKVRVGAQVMLLWNLAPKDGLANGSIGVVKGFTEHSRQPIVEFANGRTVEMDSQRWQIRVGSDVVAERSQYPLRLAWAITAHKSQGMTLDKIAVHLHRTFEYGQAYVALSRSRTLAGLFIESTREGCIRAHPEAVRFYQENL